MRTFLVCLALCGFGGCTPLENGDSADLADSPSTERLTWYFEDDDGDGYGNPEESVAKSTKPSGYVTNKLDCDDDDEEINPIADEVCNEYDDDCNSLIDGDDPGLTDGDDMYEDADLDGHGNPERPILACDTDPSVSDDDEDCDDADNDNYEDATEWCDDGEDNDCDGDIDETGCESFDGESPSDDDDDDADDCWADEDDDGYGDEGDEVENLTGGCPSGSTDNDFDCDDDDDDSDHDCGSYDEDDLDCEEGSDTYYRDEDEDGEGDEDDDGEVMCREDAEDEDDLSTNDNDCDDDDDEVYSDHVEICDNGVDDNCDGDEDEADCDEEDEDEADDCWEDSDDDGYGNPDEEVSNSVGSCPSGSVDNDEDCDDDDDESDHDCGDGGSGSGDEEEMEVCFTPSSFHVGTAESWKFYIYNVDDKDDDYWFGGTALLSGTGRTKKCADYKFEDGTEYKLNGKDSASNYFVAGCSSTTGSTESSGSKCLYGTLTIDGDEIDDFASDSYDMEYEASL